MDEALRKRAGVVAGLVLLLVACGGGDEPGGDASTPGGGSASQPGTAITEEAQGDPEVQVDPAFGPPGTEITWTLSPVPSSCKDGGGFTVEEIGATLYTGSTAEYEGGDPKKVVEGPSGKTESTGTLIVPDDAAEGPYTLAIGCSRFNEGSGTIGASGYVGQFEVTG